MILRKWLSFSRKGLKSRSLRKRRTCFERKPSRCFEALRAKEREVGEEVRRWRRWWRESDLWDPLSRAVIISRKEEAALMRSLTSLFDSSSSEK